MDINMESFGLLTENTIELEGSAFEESTEKVNDSVFSILETSKETKEKRDRLLYDNIGNFIGTRSKLSSKDKYSENLRSRHNQALDKIDKYNSKDKDKFIKKRVALNKITNRTFDKYKNDVLSKEEKENKDKHYNLTKDGSKINKEKQWQEKMHKSSKRYYESALVEALDNIKF